MTFTYILANGDPWKMDLVSVVRIASHILAVFGELYGSYAGLYFSVL